MSLTTRAALAVRLDAGKPGTLRCAAGGEGRARVPAAERMSEPLRIYATAHVDAEAPIEADHFEPQAGSTGWWRLQIGHLGPSMQVFVDDAGGRAFFTRLRAECDRVLASLPAEEPAPTLPTGHVFNPEMAGRE